MDVPILDLDAHHESLQPELDEAVEGVVSRNAFVLGEELEEFEQAFADFCGTEHCVGVNSGTEALRLALVALGIGKGDEVITVPFTFAGTVEAVLGAGADPVLVDIDPATCCMDPGAVEELVTDRTEAVLPVHLYGQPAKMDQIREIAEAHDLAIVEDACQAHGARWNGDRAGSLGDAGCFSFYPAKNIGAFGDAGAVTTDDTDLAETLRMLRNHGEKPGEKYVHHLPGVNARMDNLHAAVLGVKLPNLDGWNRKRREHARAYSDAFSSLDGVKVPAVYEAAEHVYHQYTLRVSDREAFRSFLSDRGVDTAVHYPRPIHQQPAFLLEGYEEDPFPEADLVSDQVVSLPCFPEMTEKQREHVIGSVRSFFEDGGGSS